MDIQQRKLQIKQAAKNDFWLLGAYREKRRLLDYLHEDEEVFMIVSGSREGLRGRGIIVATSERVLFIWDGWIFRETQDFPYETISSVEFNVKIIFGTFTMFGKGDAVSYNWVGRMRGFEFTKKVRSLIAKSVRNPNFTKTAEGNVVSNSQDVVFKKIEELGRLRDSGYITEYDYEIKKAELLNRL
jgi:hypothetical protein